jgi:hypothetical protein
MNDGVAVLHRVPAYNGSELLGSCSRRCRAPQQRLLSARGAIKRRVREIVEWSGGASGSTNPRNSRSAQESAARHAMARSAAKPSK